MKSRRMTRSKLLAVLRQIELLSTATHAYLSNFSVQSDSRWRERLAMFHANPNQRHEDVMAIALFQRVTGKVPTALDMIELEKLGHAEWEREGRAELTTGHAIKQMRGE